MRVLMFGWEFPPAQAGGLATATLGLVKGLLRQGADVTLVVPFPVEAPPSLSGLRLVNTARKFRRTHYRPKGLRAQGLGADEVGEHRLRVWQVPAPLYAYGGATTRTAAATARRSTGGSARDVLDHGDEVVAPTDVAGTSGTTNVYGMNLMDDVERFADVAAEIADEEPHDVIDTHDWITFAAGMRASETSGRPMVAHIHATEFDRSGEWINPAIAIRERVGMHAARRVISTSHTLARRVTQSYGVSPDRIDVVPLGIDFHTEPWSTSRAPNPFAPSPVVLFLGRVTHQKGPDRFIQLAGRVLDFVPNAHFVMAGTGDLLPSVIEWTADLGLADRIHFTGALRGQDVRHAFGMADVCVMPSVSEPFGLVALESLRAGTPCLIPRDSGVAEVLHNMLKVDSWDVDEMTNQIVALLRHRALHDELQERGAAELFEDRFGVEAPARRTLAVYQRVVRDSVDLTNGRH